MKRIFSILTCAITLVLLTSQSILAYYPSMKLNFKNVKIKRSEKEKIKVALLEYLEEKPEILKADHQRYKVDQYCLYEMDLKPETNEIDLSTIKVLDDKTNLSYNLRIIEFLRQYKNIDLKKKEADQPIQIAFKYFAF